MNISNLLEQFFSKGKVEENFYKVGHDEYAQGMLVNYTLQELKKSLEENILDSKKTLSVLKEMGFNTRNLKTDIDIDKFLASQIVNFEGERYETALKNIIVWNESTSSTLGERELEDQEKMNKLQKMSEYFNKVYSGKYKSATAVKDINVYLNNVYSILKTTFVKDRLNDRRKQGKQKKADVSSNIINNIKGTISENLLIGNIVGGNKIVIPQTATAGLRKKATFSDLLTAMPQLLLKDEIPVTKGEGKLETPYYDTVLSLRKLVPSVKMTKLKGLSSNVINVEKNQSYDVKKLKLDEIERNNELIFEEAFENLTNDELEIESIKKMLSSFSDASKFFLGLDNLKKYAVREKELFEFNDYIVKVVIALSNEFKKYQLKYGYLRDVKNMADKDKLVLNINNIELTDFINITKQNKELKENLAAIKLSVEEFNNNGGSNGQHILELIEDSLNDKFTDSESQEIEINKFLLNIEQQIKNGADNLETSLSVNNFNNETVTLDFDYFDIFEDFNELSKNITNSIESARDKFITTEIPTKREIFYNPDTLIDAPFKSDQVFARVVVDYIFEGGRVPSIVSNAGDGKTTVISSVMKLFAENFAKEVAHNQDAILNILKEGEQNIPSKEMFSKSMSMLEEYFNKGTTTILLLDEFIAAVNKAMAPMETPVEYMEYFNTLLDPDTTIKIKAPLTKKGTLNVNLQDYVKVIMTGNDPINDKVKQLFPQFMQRVQETVVDNSILWQDNKFIEKATYRILNSEINDAIGKTASSIDNHLIINEELLNDIEKYFPEYAALENTSEGQEIISKLEEFNNSLSMDSVKEIHSLKQEIMNITGQMPNKGLFEKLLTAVKVKENQDYIYDITDYEADLEENESLEPNERIALLSKFTSSKKAENVLKLLEIEGDYKQIIEDNNLYSLEAVSNYTFDHLSQKENKKDLFEKFGIEFSNDKELNKIKLESTLGSFYNKFETNNLWLYKKGELKQTIDENLEEEFIANIANDVEKRFDRVTLNTLSFMPAMLQQDLFVKDLAAPQLNTVSVKHPEGFEVEFTATRVPNFEFCQNNKSVPNIAAVNNIKSNIEDSLTIITDLTTIINKQVKEEEGYENVNLITYRLIKVMLQTYMNEFNGKDKISVDKLVQLTLQSAQLEEHGEELLEKFEELTNSYNKTHKVLNAPINTDISLTN